MLVRCIAPDWLLEDRPSTRKVIEGDFDNARIMELNEQGYHIYWLPNGPSVEIEGTVDGSHIDTFNFVYVDMDLKSGVYKTKEEFVEKLINEYQIPPTYVVDSGNGIHAYWRVTDLDVWSYLRLSRRLMRNYRTDPAVGKIFQLMRLCGTDNTKEKDNRKPCVMLHDTKEEYTCEELDRFLPRLSPEDEKYCQDHYHQTYEKDYEMRVDDTLPLKFCKLLEESEEVKRIFAGEGEDRSRDDYRLGHLMFSHGFTEEEALRVLLNCKKALSRSPQHRVNYAMQIINKVWTSDEPEQFKMLSTSVQDILRRGPDVGAGRRIYCHDVFDGTAHGFRLGEVLGLIGGSGSGKTTIALNYFWHFAQKNPDLIHLFVSLEQPEEEIAARWKKICGSNTSLHNRVHVLQNYNEDGTYRHFSLTEISDYVKGLEKHLNQKVGCLVIDHIGILKKEKTAKDESQGLMGICQKMKSVAIDTKTFLVMQSQTSREKGGVGDLELDKGAAYGTSLFECYCDFVVTTWQPLKRAYPQFPEMTCNAFKYAKIRRKNILKDKLKEDVIYALMFDPDTERLRTMTNEEMGKYKTALKLASNLRTKDRIADPSDIAAIDWAECE